MYANSFLTPEIDKERRTNSRRQGGQKGAAWKKLSFMVTSLFGILK